jgi:hypothetical protein
MLPFLLFLAVQIVPAEGAGPYRQPQLAARGKNVGIAFGAGKSVYFAGSTDHGKTFGQPVLVSSSGELFLGMHRGPRVAYTKRGIVVSAIVGERGKGQDGDLVAWRSTDGGKSWLGPVHVNDVAGSAREGLHAMASNGQETVFTAWLDLRQKGTRIFGSISHDGGATWSDNRLVYESPSGSVCQCCHPSVTIDASGRIHVMFRNALDGSRDLYLTRSDDGGKTFGDTRRLGEGTWKVDACPMDGGGLAVDERGSVAAIWRREGTIFATDSAAAETPVGPGKNPTVASTRKGTYGAFTRDGAVLVKRPGEEARILAEGSFPAVAALENGSALVAYESDGAITIQTIP